MTNELQGIRAPRSMQQSAQAPCCEGSHGPQASEAPTAKQAFAALMQAAGEPGRIDARTKELITFALAVLSRCGPCVEHHLRRAAEMGISREELDEAAWCAAAIGGAAVRMFYLEALQAAEPRGRRCC